MRVLLFGPVGSGKSTQAAVLAKKLNVPHLSTGDFFRDLASKNSKLSKVVKEKLGRGELVADALTLRLIKEELKNSRYRLGYVIDGFPRNVHQAEAFKNGIDRAIYLDVSDEAATSRLLKRRRRDDTKELIKKRLTFYHQETEPIISFYGQLGILERVDGERSIEDISKDIFRKVNT